MISMKCEKKLFQWSLHPCQTLNAVQIRIKNAALHTNYIWLANFKAALMNIFISTMDKMTIFNVKGVFVATIPPRVIINWLQFPSALHSVLESFCSLFWFSGFPDCTPPAEPKTSDKVSNYLVKQSGAFSR